jgi:two-component system nitrogen regulation response regulator NtrX
VRCQSQEIDRSALDLLQSYSWPGNVRELKNIIERFSILNLYNKISAEDVAAELKIKYQVIAENNGKIIAEPERVIAGEGEAELANAVRKSVIDNEAKQSPLDYPSEESILRSQNSYDIENIMSADLFHQAKENFEKAYLVRKLKENENNITKTAQIIGMSRRNLQKKISALKIIF